MTKRHARKAPPCNEHIHNSHLKFSPYLYFSNEKLAIHVMLARFHFFVVCKLNNMLSSNKNCWIIANDPNKSEVNSEWFNDSYWLNQGRLLGASSGRGSAWMVKSNKDKMMLRHYYRGGIPAHFNKDKYLWTGLEKTRSFSEYRLLEKMIKLDLPVPAPIAAQACKKGIFYQANILIQYLPHQFTFAGILNSQEKESSATWQHIGDTIALFHNHGIYHADLNANNILINDTTIYLIDFDHSKQRPPHKQWQQSNLKRLKRSIDKLTHSDYIRTNEKKWLSLLQAYKQKINIHG